MKILKLICCAVVALITASGLVSVHGKRQKPKHDEIERVLNNTHSVIWRCTNTECPPGSGLSVQCGSSIPFSTPITCVPCVKGVNTSSTHDYSTCRSCRNCGKHELWIGDCTPEEDTIECLGTCDKGFYSSKISEACHPCSYCCGEDAKYHEEQCEDSGLPSSKQCRQTNLKCYPPTEADHNHQPENQGDLEAVEIAAIAIGSVIFVIIVLTVVIQRYYSWQEVKCFFKRCCCFCCKPMFSKNCESTVRFDANGHEYQDQDLESTSCAKANGSRLREDAKIQGLEKSSVTDQGTSTTELHLSSKIKFANIPQGFLDCCLTKRMLTIPIEFRCTICKKIDTHRELFWDDYRLLAEKIGLGADVILWLGQQRNKTELILQQFDAQEDPSVRRFKEILEVMERNDVVTVIEDWLLFEWNKQNNSSAVL